MVSENKRRKKENHPKMIEDANRGKRTRLKEDPGPDQND